MNIKYKLCKITETSFFFNYDYNYSNLNPKELRYYLSHRVINHLEDETIIIKMEAEITNGETNSRLALNEIAIEFRFLSHREAASFMDNNILATQNANVMDTLLQATVGTLRGVLMKNLKGTPLELYPLPLISSSFFRVED